MKASVVGEVESIEIEAEYRGTVYEKTVTIRADSTLLDCFDGKNHITNDDSKVNLILLGRACEVHNVSQNSHYGFEMTEESDKKLSKWHCSLQGTVLSTDVSNEYLQKKHDLLLLLDIGIGTILIEPGDDLIDGISAGDITTGSNLNMECSRLDIVGRNND